MADNISTRTNDEMKPVLLDKGGDAPEIFYYMLRGGVSVGNITILTPGQAGEEYVKTLGHYHSYDFTETYRVLEGEGLMLLQKRKESEQGEPINAAIEEFRVVRLSRGDELSLPLHFGHCLVNIGETFLVTRDDSPSDAASEAARPHADYEPIKEQGGMAFFVIKQGGLPALVQNPNYTDIGDTDFAGIPVID